MKNRNGLVRAFRHVLSVVAVALGSLLLATPASAHHAMGGATPSNAFEGFLSGLAHPVLGLDHLAFLVAAGLLGAYHRRGLSVPVAFVTASLITAGVHPVASVLPAPASMISWSVVLFCALLFVKPRSLSLVAALAATAGIFHGNAYGESIVGAELTPLSAYLLGLLLVQLGIALAAQRLFRLFRPAPGIGLGFTTSREGRGAAGT